MPRRWRISFPAAALSVLLPGIAPAQQQGGAPGVEAYFRAMGEHFRLSRDEVAVLSAWGLPPDHLPVVLFMARRSGTSPDALISQRRGGLRWSELACRAGLDASAFHVLLPRNASLGRLAAAYARYEETPPSRWATLHLADGEIVDLVNIRFLGAVLEVPPLRVLEAASRTGSYVAAYDRLRGPG